MSAITLTSLSYHLPQENPVIFPSAAQEAEFLHLIDNMGLFLKREAFTPMHIAAALGDIDACKQFMASGWDPNEVGECGFSPFFMFATIYLKKQQESEHPDLDTTREMANLLFDALYAKGGFDLRGDIFPKVVLHCLQRSALYHAKIEQPIIDILNIDPLMSTKRFKNKKNEELSLLEYAQEAQLSHVRAYLKILSRVNGPLPITYAGNS